MTFARRLKTALANASMRPYELAHKSGVSRASVSQYLTGVAQPRQQTIESLAGALGCEAAFLAGEYEVKDTDGADCVRRVSVPRAAIALEVDEERLRDDLQKGVTPFGYATPPDDSNGYWRYHISRKRLEEYIGVLD